MSALVEVKGAKQLRADLTRAGVDMQEWKDTHALVAGIVAGAVRAPRRSGRLAGSVRPAGQARAAIVRAGGAKVPYAGVQEWGWPKHGITGRHYLTGAAKSTESRWLTSYETRVQEIVDSVTSGVT